MQTAMVAAHTASNACGDFGCKNLMLRHWNIPMFKRKYIFERWIFHCHMLVFGCGGGGGLGSLNYSLSGQGEETSSLNVAGNLEVFPENKSG